VVQEDSGTEETTGVSPVDLEDKEHVAEGDLEEEVEERLIKRLTSDLSIVIVIYKQLPHLFIHYYLNSSQKN
jgi:hypothetical protein